MVKMMYFYIIAVGIYGNPSGYGSEVGMVVAMTGGRELVVVDGNRGQSSGMTSDVFPHSTSTSGDNDEIKAGSL